MRASELTNRRELRALQVGEAFEWGHSTGLGSLYTHTQTKGKGVSPSWQTSQNMPDIDGDDGAAGAPYIHSLPLYTMETRTTTWVQLCIQQKLHDLEIAHWCRAISRLHNLSAQS